MNAEQLRERLSQLEQEHQAITQHIQQVTAQEHGLQGRILECKYWLAEMEQESEGEDD